MTEVLSRAAGVRFGLFPKELEIRDFYREYSVHPQDFAASCVIYSR